MRLGFLSLIIICLSCYGHHGQAQDVLYALEETSYRQDTLYRIETLDGNVFVGTLISQDPETVRLKTEKFGELTFQRKDIRSMVRIDRNKIVDGNVWMDHPQDARYFFAPSGYNLRQGEAYYQNAWIFYNQFSAGVTDHFTLGAGLIPLFLFNGTPTPVWLTAKGSLPVVKNKFNIGAGALVGTVIGESNAGFGIAFATTTFGSRTNNLSIGLGQAFSSEGIASTPMVNISGIVRFSDKGFFMTENYYIGIDNNYMLMLSAGGRYIIRRASLDFGLLLPIISGEDVVVAIPWLGLTIPLNKVK